MLTNTCGIPATLVRELPVIRVTMLFWHCFIKILKLMTVDIWSCYRLIEDALVVFPKLYCGLSQIGRSLWRLSVNVLRCTLEALMRQHCALIPIFLYMCTTDSKVMGTRPCDFSRPIMVVTHDIFNVTCLFELFLLK